MKRKSPKSDYESLEVYRISRVLAARIWDMVDRWGSFEKDAIGDQLIRSSDSIGASIAEGVGIGTSADFIRFAKMARSSLFETKHWIRKAYSEHLITEKDMEELTALIEELRPRLHAYITAVDSHGTFGR